jgi:xanthine dehydrogenase FAD-binding subunit
MVDHLYPSSLKEALLLKKNFVNARIYAGGSDLMVMKNANIQFLFIHQIEELKKVEENEEFISIGAGAVYYDLLTNPLIPQLLKEVIKEIASPAIRNMATIGGNICNASPAGDTLPTLYLYDAKLVISSLDEKNHIIWREEKIGDFITGVRKINLRDDEILTSILLPKDKISEVTKTSYKKVGARKAQAISKVQFVGVMNVKEDKIIDFRVAFGSVGPTVIRKKEIEERYTGITKEELKEKIPEILDVYDSCIHPIDDQRSTAVYRKKVSLNLLEDFLNLDGGADEITN